MRFDEAALARSGETKERWSEDGYEDAFDVSLCRKNSQKNIFRNSFIFCSIFQVLGGVQEVDRTGIWVGDCFIYTNSNSANRLNYYVDGEIITVFHLDRVMYLLGYIPRDNRLYLGDKELNVVSYSLLLSVLEY